MTGNIGVEDFMPRALPLRTTGPAMLQKLAGDRDETFPELIARIQAWVAEKRIDVINIETL